MLISRLSGGAAVRTCDVFMGYAYEGYSAEEYAALQARRFDLSAVTNHLNLF